MQLHKNI